MPSPIPSRSLLAALATFGMVTSTSAGRAAEPQAEPAWDDPLCVAPDDLMPPTRWLRSASLDVRGQLPTPEETAAVVDAEATGEAGAAEAAVVRLIDEWLASEAFADRFVRLHRELLWNNISNLTPYGVSASLSLGNNTTTAAYRSGAIARRLRGADVRCLNEPAQFGDDGAVLATLQDDGSMREGWVEVRPYWAPDTTIRVCAFDAQAGALSANGVSCNSNLGTAQRDCGCGPNLNWCATSTQARTLMQAFAEDVDRRVRDIIRDDRSYLDLFTTSRGYVNGPIVHFLRHQTQITRMRIQPLFVDLERLPALEWHQTDTWVPVELGPHHAGVLTSPAFLIRFQTARARANRFYTAFLCRPFNPSADGVAVEDIDEPDLQERAGCNYCHAELEPAAAHWGRWGERGTSFLDPAAFPAYDPQCESCARSSLACPTRCTQNYVTRPLSDKEAEWTGWLLGYTFRREEHMLAVEEGPDYLALTEAVEGRLPRCVAQTALGKLLGAAEDVTNSTWIDLLAQTFVASDFRYREVVRDILLDETYRRAR
jgi:hypothetical protein